MGEVYRARDTRLERDVAIKTLPPTYAADPDRLHRLRQEARAVAALNHPHICQLYDVGPDYLVMEYIEGHPLRCPLPRDEAVQVAREMAAALEEAHGKGILHRDLKPGNIMIASKGGAKLLDFGLARFENADLDATRTLEGTIVGTSAYMSPEQAQGRLLDARSDIFSFGAVLYEMLSGVRAFGGETMAEVIAAVMRDDPPPLPAQMQPLESVIRRCLAKHPDQRFQSIADLRAALEQGAHGSDTVTLHRPPSLAVLPFANVSADPENEYFSDGLAEEIINALMHVPGLKVIARTSSFAFKGRNDDVRRIAETLGVAHVLEGSVRKAGSRIRVVAQLVAAADGTQLWSARYDRELADAFAIQDEIAQAIASELRVTLTAAGDRAAGRRTDSIDAHHFYLKGRFHWGKRTARDLQRAIRYYRDALECDPTYAPAYAGLAECYVPLAYYGHMLPRDAWFNGRAAATQAVEIDPALSEARAVLAWSKTFIDWDPRGGEDEFRRTLERDPEYGRARQGLAEHLVATGRFDEAATQIRRALQSDPLALNIHAAVGMIEYFSRRYDRAIEQLERTLEMDRHFYPAHWYLGLCCEQTGDFPGAVAELQQAAALSDNSTMVRAGLAGVYAVSGEHQQARLVFEELQRASGQVYVSQVLMAVILARLGDEARALACLERAYEEHCPLLLYAMVDPRLDALRAHPRFTELVRRIGLAGLTTEAPVRHSPTSVLDGRGAR
jgi:eukaryotic-like serine/threonine-protein kinase